MGTKRVLSTSRGWRIVRLDVATCLFLVLGVRVVDAWRDCFFPELLYCIFSALSIKYEYIALFFLGSILGEGVSPGDRERKPNWSTLLSLLLIIRGDSSGVTLDFSGAIVSLILAKRHIYKRKVICE